MPDLLDSAHGAHPHQMDDDVRWLKPLGAGMAVLALGLFWACVALVLAGVALTLVF